MSVYEPHVGRRVVREDIVAPGPARALAATLGRPSAFALGDRLPEAWHILYGLPIAPNEMLGPDGMPREDELVPPIALPRRMFAGTRHRFHDPLRIGDAIRLESELSRIEEKTGRSGRLVFTTVTTRISTSRGLAVESEEDVVFRDMPRADIGLGAPNSAVEMPGPWRVEVRPTQDMLVRFSALLFNVHRIHYDRDYACRVEGYPGLVVHGPLTLLHLLGLLRANESRPIATLAMRARAPLFDGDAFTAAGGPHAGGARLQALAPDGRVAMEVEVTFAG